MIKTAVIPAAGSATRLRPLTNNCHKCMLPLGQTTMIKLILAALQDAGVEEAIIITGFMAEDLRAYIDEACPSIKTVFVHNSEFISTNNAYSLYLARDFVDGEQFMLMDSDIIFEKEIIKRVIRSQFNNLAAVKMSKSLGEEEMKIFSSNGQVIERISKEGIPGEAIGESIGIEKFDKNFSTALFKTLEERINLEGGRNEFYERAFQQLIDQGHVLNCLDISDLKVMEVDFAEDLEKAKKTILPYISQEGH